MISYQQAKTYISQLLEIVGSLPDLDPVLREDLHLLEKQFGEINLEVDQVFHFLKNPNEKVIQELKQKFDTAENEAKKLERELFQKLSEPGRNF